MSSKWSEVTMDDVLASAKVNGDDGVLEFKFDCARGKLKTSTPQVPSQRKRGGQQNKESDTPNVTWIPISFITASKETKPLYLRFDDVLSASNAKISQFDAKNPDPKKVIVSFRNFSKDEIVTGGYVPKTKDTISSQDKENARMTMLIQRVYDNTLKFNEVMRILDTSYRKCVQDGLEYEESIPNELPFTFRKDKKKELSKIEVYGLRQLVVYEGEDDFDGKELDTPITRINLPIYNGVVCSKRYNKYIKGPTYHPIVFDLIEKKRRNTEQDVEAMVKVNGRPQPLNHKTAGEFITFLSRLSGIIYFKDCTVSISGISFTREFSQLHVIKHKQPQRKSLFSQAKIADDMLLGDLSDESDEDASNKNELNEEQSYEAEPDTMVKRPGRKTVLKQVRPKPTLASEDDSDIERNKLSMQQSAYDDDNDSYSLDN